ncbi:hypothetical protein KC980_01945, partial [candidate division WWE3 bacterium]|nr:hypothetical protein [candidate division WWE3 bacterium]
GSCETYTGTHECRTVCTDTLNCTHQIKDKEMPYGIDAEGNPVSDGACIGDIQVDTKVEYYRVADVGGQDMSGFHQYSTAFMTPFSSEATRDVTGRRFVDATAENEIDGNPGYGHHRNNAYNIGAEAYADVFRATTADPGYSDEPAPELLAAKNNGSIPGQGGNDGGDFELPPISTDDCFTSGFLDLFSGYSGDINPTYNSADILQRVANAQTSDGTNLTLIEVYATAAQQYGVPCELLVGIHIREGGGDPRKSVISGRLLGTPEPDQGGKVYTTLLASALDAARVLNEKAKYFAGGSIRDFSSMVTAVSKYNGGGNSNCGRGCPTFNGPCPPPSGVDDIYPMSKIDAAHDRMCLIYCADGSLCSTPVPWNNPGVLPIAYQFHQMVKGGQ